MKSNETFLKKPVRVFKESGGIMKGIENVFSKITLFLLITHLSTSSGFNTDLEVVNCRSTILQQNFCLTIFRNFQRTLLDSSQIFSLRSFEIVAPNKKAYEV